MAIKQVTTESLAIHALGNPNGGKGRQPQFLGHMQCQTEGFQACPQPFGVAPMTSPGILDALLGQEAQGLPHAEVHVHRSGVVIHPIGAPVLIEQGNIEIPIGNLGGAGKQLGLGAGSHGERAKARGAAEALLTAAVSQVDFPVIEEERNTPEGCDRVEEQQAVVLAAKITDALHRLAHPGGGFGMHHRQDGWLVGGEGFGDLGLAEGLAPRAFNRDHLGAVAAGHIN